MARHRDGDRPDRSPSPLSREGTCEREEAGLRHSAVLPADFHEPVRADSADRIAGPSTVVEVEENSEDVIPDHRGFVRRSDVDAHGPSGVRRGERVGNRRVQPVVRSAGEPVIRDPIAIVVAVRRRVRDAVVVEVIWERINGIRHAVSVRIVGRRRPRRRRWPRGLRHRSSREDSAGDVRVEVRRGVDFSRPESHEIDRRIVPRSDVTHRVHIRGGPLAEGSIDLRARRRDADIAEGPRARLLLDR